MTKELEQIQNSIIEKYADFAEILAQNRATGVIWGALALKDKDLTMNELSELTGYSLSSLSTYLKLLELTGRVKRRKEDGVTKFRVVSSLQEVILNLLQVILEKYIEPTSAALNQAEVDLKKLKQTEDVKHTLKVIKKLQKQHKRSKNLINLSRICRGFKIE